MDRKEAFEKLKAIVCSQLGIEESKVTEETRFMDLGADSLDLVEIVMEIENEFDITMPDETMGKIVSVSDAIDAIVAQA